MKSLVVLVALGGVAHAELFPMFPQSPRVQTTRIGEGDTAYAAFGAGPAGTLRGTLGQRFQAGEAAMRLAVGYREGLWAIEGVFAGGEVEDAQFSGISKLMSLGLELKRHVPLSRSWSVYARGGVHRNFTDDTLPDEPVLRGSSIAGGVGIQVGAYVPGTSTHRRLAEMSAWLDLGAQRVRLADDEMRLAGSIRTVLLGVSLGL